MDETQLTAASYEQDGSRLLLNSSTMYKTTRRHVHTVALSRFTPLRSHSFRVTSDLIDFFVSLPIPYHNLQYR